MDPRTVARRALLRVASIALAACLLAVGQVARAVEGMERCAKLPAGSGRDRCVRELANASRDPAICQEIGDVNQRVFCAITLDPRPETAERCVETTAHYRSACWRHAAYTLRDESWCRHMTPEGLADHCVAHLAIRRDVTDPCNRFEDLKERNECYRQRAREEGNPSLCGRIGHESFEWSCYDESVRAYAERAAQSADWSACDDARLGDRRPQCIIHLAKRLGSHERCASLQNWRASKPDPRVGPTSLYADQCFSAAAETSRDPAACRHVAKPGARASCVAGSAIRVEQCAEAGDRRDACLSRVSELSSDASACRLIGDPYRRADCHDRSRSGGYGDCDDIDDPALRDDCRLQEAAWEGAPQRCRKISDAAKRSACQTLADLEELDPAACRSLEERYRSACLMRLAMARRDPTLCDDLEDPEEREWCRGLASAADQEPVR